MTRINLIRALTAALVLGSFVASADAQPRREQHRGDHRGGGGRGGYYAPPPVIYYGAPYVYAPVYVPPPVVYGPAVGIYLPGVSIGIQ